MKIFICSDHAGFELKGRIISFLKNDSELSELKVKFSLQIIDKGPFKFDKDDDYPDFVKLVASEISKAEISPSEISTFSYEQPEQPEQPRKLEQIELPTRDDTSTTGIKNVPNALRTIRAIQEEARGIIIGLSGQGEAIVANRFRNVRAVVYYGGNLEIIKLAREHNNSNILSLGAKFLSPEDAFSAVKLWLNTVFSGEKRHLRRILKIPK